MKSLIIILIVFFIVGTGLYYKFNPLAPTVTINGRVFTVELAITQAEAEKGLSGRDALPLGHGMIFLKDHKDRYLFWMKDMKFPLDFIWIDGNRIVDITTDVLPSFNGEISKIMPKVPVDKILELNAGEVKKANISIGDTVLFNK